MKRLLALLLAMLMALALVGCGSGGGDSAADDKGTADNAGASDAAEPSVPEGDDPYADLDNYELSFSMHSPAESTIGQAYQAMFDEIYEKSHGHLKITIFGGGTLAANNAVGDAVKTGAADMGWLFTSFYNGQFPMTDVLALPMLGQTTCVRGTEVLWDIRDEYPAMDEEWGDYHVVNMYANPVNIPYLADKEPTDISVFKGLTMRTADGGAAATLSGWGVNAIQMSPNEIYESIQKHNIQGYTFEPTGIIDFSLQEVTKYKLDLGIFQATFCTIMNKDKYNSLPAELQAILDEYSTREQSVAFATVFDNYVTECDQKFVDAGGIVVEPTEAQVEEYRVSADAYTEQWIKDHTTADFDAQAYVDFVIDAFAQH